jgi:hypothetical protein
MLNQGSAEKTRVEVTENGLQWKTSRVKATREIKGYMQNGRIQMETGLWSL